MPPRCKAPKCAEVKNKCACPNPWIEFLAKNASDGKATMAEHSAAYKRLKDSGAFKPKAGLNNGGCKSDPVKLCAWKHVRKPVARMIKSRNDRLIRREIKDFKFSRSPADVKKCLEFLFGTSGLDTDIVDDDRVTEAEKLEFYADEFELGKRGIKLKQVLGRGVGGCVVEGTYNGKVVAIKFAYGNVGLHNRDTDIEVHNHKLMSKALPNMVPKLLTAFKMKGKKAPEEWQWIQEGAQPYFDVLVMEKIDYEFDKLYLKNKDDSKFVRQAAKQLKEMIMALRKKKIVHGDLHLSNMGYKLVRGVPKLFLIDFAAVRPMEPDETYEDICNVWWKVGEDASHAPLKKMLEAIDFPKAPEGFVSPGDEGYYRYWTKTRKVAHIPLG
jgi:RIO1 family